MPEVLTEETKEEVDIGQSGDVEACVSTPVLWELKIRVQQQKIK
jgi:PIN domain nuclease of toxin-antitoxin system